MNPRALPPSCSGCTWSASGERECRASRASCWTAAAQVSGSDAKESRGVAALRARGAQVRIGHDASSLDMLPGGPTVVVSTHAAIPKDNPELVEAHRRGIPVILRPAVLAQLMDGYTTVMVTGTHGKTTTTSMIVVALQQGGFDPSFAVGGDLGEAGHQRPSRQRRHASSPRPTRATAHCCSTPRRAVVTNVEADHLDFFGSVEAYAAVFERVRRADTTRWCAGRLRRRSRRGGAGRSRPAERCPRTALRQRSGTRIWLQHWLDWEQQGTGSVRPSSSLARPGPGHATGGAREAHGAECAGGTAGRR